MRAVLTTLLALLLLGQPITGWSQSDEEKARANLKALQADIKRINREIGNASSRRSTLQNQLREAELEQAKLERETTDNLDAIAEQKQSLIALEAEKATLLEAKDEQASRITMELQTAWKMGQQGQIKVLLNQENPDTIARMMSYYRYFFRARNELLQQYRLTLNELASTEKSIADTLADLDQRQQTLQRQQQQLAKAQQARKQAVAQLNESIADKGAELKQMQQDQQKLQELLDALEAAVVNMEVPDNYQPFKAAKGKMPWPISGRANYRFGDSRNEGKMRWQGVLIPGKAGTQVKAIHHGRVVYSDWLRGMGLLTIIDHGEGYMSLYAHNQTLLRDVGEWVTAGTNVGTVGNTGGLVDPALYFEIRHKGKPTNPANWCRR